jgi:hypothetical protein
MSQVVRLPVSRRLTQPTFLAQPTFFNRRELNLLLSVYSRRVADGAWRDYAIDHRPGMAMFAVFRHTLDRPLFVVAKQTSQGKAEFTVLNGRHKVRSGRSLDEVLDILEPRLRPVG